MFLKQKKIIEEIWNHVYVTKLRNNGHGPSVLVFTSLGFYTSYHHTFIAYCTVGKSAFLTSEHLMVIGTLMSFLSETVYILDSLYEHISNLCIQHQIKNTRENKCLLPPFPEEEHSASVSFHTSLKKTQCQCLFSSFPEEEHSASVSYHPALDSSAANLPHVIPTLVRNHLKSYQFGAYNSQTGWAKFLISWYFYPKSSVYFVHFYCVNPASYSVYFEWWVPYRRNRWLLDGCLLRKHILTQPSAKI